MLSPGSDRGRQHSTFVGSLLRSLPPSPTSGVSPLAALGKTTAHVRSPPPLPWVPCGFHTRSLVCLSSTSDPSTWMSKSHGQSKDYSDPRPVLSLTFLNLKKWLEPLVCLLKVDTLGPFVTVFPSSHSLGRQILVNPLMKYHSKPSTDLCAPHLPSNLGFVPKDGDHLSASLLASALSLPPHHGPLPRCCSASHARYNLFLPHKAAAATAAALTSQAASEPPFGGPRSPAGRTLA